MNYQEYEICKQRGHAASPVSMSIGNTIQYTCKYCGTKYHFTEPELVEEKVPEKGDNDSNFTTEQIIC